MKVAGTVPAAYQVSGTAVGGILAERATGLTIRSSIVAGNFGVGFCALSSQFPPNCPTTPADVFRLEAIDVTDSLIGDIEGTNLAEAPLGSPDANGNLVGNPHSLGVIDPRLGALADNGGPTQTHLLLTGSPAIDSGANPLDLDTDQRGLPRQFSAAIDMGAVELLPEIFIVNSTDDDADVSPGDGICDDGAGNCTLRAAMEEANALVNGVFPDEIHFDISGTGLRTIQPLRPLPTITDAVIIDGVTQTTPNASPLTFLISDPPEVEIDGSLAGDGASGFKINPRGGGSTIRGLAINRFDAHGVFVSRRNDNRVEKNFIGTDWIGTVALGNGDAGVMILNGADNVVGGSFVVHDGNVISGNGRGVAISGRLASGNQIVGNLVGVDASGAAELGNRGAGIEIAGAPNNVVGSFEGINVISGNRAGVEIRSAAATGNTVMLNKIGTDESGQTALPNRIGVSIRKGAAANQVLGNQIAGNLGDGVNLTRSNGNRIDSNQIGGELLGNGGDGADIRGGQGNVVGGNLAIASNAPANAVLDLAQGNRISGNGGYGVNVVGDGNLIQFNTIGKVIHDQEGNRRGGIQILNSSNNAIRENEVFKNQGPGVLINGSTATANIIQGNGIGLPKFHLGGGGLPDLGNTVGVEIRNAHDNLIGGSEAVEGNVISNNDRYGVHIHGAGSGNRVQGNEIGVGSEVLSFDTPPEPVILFAPEDRLALQPEPAPIDLGPVSSRTIPAPNGRDGVFVESDGNVIGGAADGAGNIIAGNGRHGVLLTGDRNRIEGNTIGAGVLTVFGLPNAGDGIRIRGSNNVVGAAADEAGSVSNTIAFNSGSGVRVSSGTGNAVTQNSIFDNGGLGIDLGRTGSNANDGPRDADTGANNLQNTPEILRTRRTATHLQIIFLVPSQAPHSTYPIRAEFFAADDDGQEGRTFLVATEVLLPTPTVILIPLADLPPGAQIVATATDANGNTLEFSSPVSAEQPPAATADEMAADLAFQQLGN